MPSRRRNKRTKGRSKGSGSMSAVVSELKQLVTVARQQALYPQPNTVDVPFPSMKGKVYSIVAGYTVGAITIGTTSTAGAFSFSLNSLPSVSAFSGCFDQFRVLHWELNFLPVVATNLPSGTPLYTCLDFDDANTPTAEIAQRDTAMAAPVNTFFSRSLCPRIAVAAYGGAFTQFANLPGTTWVDMVSASTQYYGLKYFSTTTNATAVQIYSIMGKVHLQFKKTF